MKILIAHTDAEIESCFEVMLQLRPDLERAAFVPLVRRLQGAGYRLAMLIGDENEAPGKVVALAGFRLGESLAWKRYLYVDDLVTLPNQRSKGYGAALLHWLTQFAEQQNCQQFHLDSGVQRIEAHRFYQRENMQVTSYHFAKRLNLQKE